MPNVQWSGPTPANMPYSQLAEPPTASDGNELYIEKLLAQGGMVPSAKNKDSFEKAGVPSAQTNRTWADQALKWAGVIFAGALAVVGLKYAFGGAAKSAVQTRVK
ncbi:hypothetical protein [Vampirovibrio sp.]|uniref:hypothetical protein n=1 Tax=Vampirovibrio sp. TaxID=2717857 RepID=UPI0035947B6D